MIQVLPSTKANIKFAAEQIKQNNIVAFPTETVYGLGARLTQIWQLIRFISIKIALYIIH